MDLDGVARRGERSQPRRARTSVVRVLYLHATPASHAQTLRRHLAWLQEQLHVIDFAAFDRIVRAPVPSANSKPSLLLTFDDGIASNYAVAAPLLEAAGVRALFFVVPEFSVRSGEDAYRFCRERIRSRHVEAAMTPGQIADLAARGHTIGNHTFSHANLLKTSPSEYEREIIESAAVIESWIGRPVDTFAWPFTWRAITPAAFRLAAERHWYCFGPCPGRTRGGAGLGSPFWRTNFEAHFRPAEVRFQCSGLADLAASARRRQLSRLLAPHAGTLARVSERV
jgi:peptidoglycan/xylan/chitin deacetylase (PgdA/CDA1 family)